MLLAEHFPNYVRNGVVNPTDCKNDLEYSSRDSSKKIVKIGLSGLRN